MFGYSHDVLLGMSHWAGRFFWVRYTSCINLLWPSDAIWQHRSGSTLAQVMACCLKAPSHYLNQCWLIINGILWYSPCNNFTSSAWDISTWYEFENYNFEITATSPRGQWVNSALHHQMYCDGMTQLVMMLCCHFNILNISYCWLVKLMPLCDAVQLE